jgi:plasmid maintenance system killer protein
MDFRYAIWKRDRGRCGSCPKEVSFDRLMEVDHIVPFGQGGSDEPSNLRATHSRCNQTRMKRPRRASPSARPTTERRRAILQAATSLRDLRALPPLRLRRDGAKRWRISVDGSSELSFLWSDSDHAHDIRVET